MKYLRPLLAAFLLLPFTLIAQDHQHIMGPTETIEGFKHPELIPDLTAYRMYFLAASSPANATAEESAKHWTHIRALGMNFADSQVVGTALVEFRSKYDDMITKFNGTANMDQKSRPDYSLLIERRDALVQATINKIRASITADGGNLLTQAIEKQKTRIRIVQAKSQ